MNLSELWIERTGFDPMNLSIIMPLTNSLEITSPETVIGFAVMSEGELSVHTIEKREWESSADFTGLTYDVYTDGMKPLDEIVVDMRKYVSRPVVAYSGGMCSRALEICGIFNWCIDINKAITTMKAQSRFKHDVLDTEKDFATWLNKGTVMRKVNRFNMLSLHGLHSEDHEGVPVFGRNLGIDRTLWEYALSQRLTADSEVYGG